MWDHLRTTHNITKENTKANGKASKLIRLDENNYPMDETDQYSEKEIVDENANGTSTPVLRRTKKETFVDKLLEFLIQTNQAISIVEQPSFKDLVKFLSDVEIPCRQTITNKTIPSKVI